MKNKVVDLVGKVGGMLESLEEGKEKYIIILLSQKFEKVKPTFEKKAVKVFPGISVHRRNWKPVS